MRFLIAATAICCLVIALGACSTPVSQSPGPRTELAAVPCPFQPKPVFPQAAVEQKIYGKIVAIAHVKDGAVVGVEFPSGPEIYYPAIEAAMRRYKCKRLDHDVYAKQIFDMKPE